MPVSRVSLCLLYGEKLSKSHRCCGSSQAQRWLLLVAPRLIPNFRDRVSEDSPNVFAKTFPSIFLSSCRVILQHFENQRVTLSMFKWPTSQSSTGVNLSALFIFVVHRFVVVTSGRQNLVDNMSRQTICTVGSSTLIRKPAKKQPANSKIYIDKRPATLLSSA